MKRPDSLADDLVRLERLRSDPTTAESIEALGAALRQGVNVLAAKAARIAADFELASLVPDLAVAFDRFMTNPVRTDKGCTAKIAAADALAAIGADERDLYRRGMRHVQKEPSFGRSIDTAAELRASCATGLGNLRSADALVDIVALLADAEAVTRAGAARAIARCGRVEGVLPLRLKALIGDPEPQVIRECFDSVIELVPRESLEFVAAFLHGPEDLVVHAAEAIGASRRADAIELLKGEWNSSTDSVYRSLMLTAIGSTRLDGAREFLIRLIEEESEHTALAALDALSPWRRDAALSARVASIASTRRLPGLTEAWESRPNH